MSGRYTIEYVGRDLCGTDIATFRFTRPKGYDFASGQWFTPTIETAEGMQTKTFSHSSAPGDDWIELTTRLSGSAFKNALLALAPGTSVTMSGPGGHLGLPESADKVAFLVGGVGITPVRSILRDAQQRGRRFEDALLMYGNRDESCMPFRAELEGMADIGVRLVHCFERAPDSWAGERGFITAEMTLRYLGPSDERLFLVAGPPVMVSAMERVLDQLQIPAARRLVERFGAAG
ncbi:MAG: FAD-dependent oxidoreductase [Coriobacteriia bacterium]|nr:FAD-dependent oxidoreductase [Coriobacteriia bacterium]